MKHPYAVMAVCGILLTCESMLDRVAGATGGCTLVSAAFLSRAVAHHLPA